jgi:hypothetical protein
MPIRGLPNGLHHARPQAGRDRPEWVVAINRSGWSQSIVARTGQLSLRSLLVAGVQKPAHEQSRRQGLVASLLAQQDAHARVQGQIDPRNIAFRWPPVLRGIP